MNLLRSFSHLLQRNALAVQQQQHHITLQETKMRKLEQQLHELSALSQGLKQTIRGLYITGRSSSAELFVLQRKQSTLRRRLLDIDARVVQLQADMTTCQQVRNSARQKWQQLLRQENKYQHVYQFEKNTHQFKCVLSDETEAEEISAWNRSSRAKR